MLITIKVIGRRFRVEGAACSRCRYPVKGLDVLRCPECGADLRRVGILTPWMAPRAHWVIWAALWTLVFPPLGLAVAQTLVDRLGKTYAYEITLDVSPNREAVFHDVRIELNGIGVPRKPVYESGTLSLVGSGVPDRVISLDLPGLGYSIEQPDGSYRPGEAPIDAEVLAAWFGEMEGTTPAEQLPTEAQELLTIITTLVDTGTAVTGGSFLGASMSQSTEQVISPWLRLVTMGPIGLVWAAGLALIVSRGRRAQRRHAEAMAAME
jgi:hypothetical protein